MTIQLELSPAVEARLASEATARGIPIENYAQRLLQEALTPLAAGNGVLAPGDIKAMTKVMTEGAENLPVLAPEATKRNAFYEDRG